VALYADDSALIASRPDSKNVAESLSRELNLCRGWLNDNRLSLYLGKTECVLFGSKRKLNKEPEFDMVLGETVVGRVTSVLNILV
jgi:hypothetical protein